MKTDSSIYSDLLNSFNTTQEVNDFLGDLDFVSAELFKSRYKSLSEILASISATSAKNIEEIFTKNKSGAGNKETINGFLEQIKNSLKNFKTIKLTLAFEPSSKTIEKIHNHVLNTLGQGYILEIEVSENIMGGAIVIFNGKYEDYSIKKSLEESFRDNRSVILN